MRARRHVGRAAEPRRAAARASRTVRCSATSRTSTPCSPSPEDWSRDPWSGEQHDGFVWGRGALDMKSQTAAEVVAGAALAREGWRPPRGELKIISVADEEVGGLVGAQWLTQERPDLARCDMLLNEGAGPRHALRRPPPLRRLLRREGDVPLRRPRERPRRPRVASPRSPTTRCSSCSPTSSGSDGARVTHDLTDPPRAFLSAIGLDPAGPRRRAGARMRGIDERLAAMIEPTFGVDLRADDHRGVEQDQRRSPPGPSSRSTAACPPGMGAEETMARVREALGDTRRRSRSSSLEEVDRQQLAGRVAADGRDPRLGRRGRARRRGRADPCCPPSPTRAGSATRSPTASPTASSRMQHMTLYDTWPLIHGADERIDVRDLGFAARLLPRAAEEAAGMTEHGQAPPRRDGAAQRAARARARPTGPPRCGPTRARSRSRRARSRGCAPSTACRACAASRGSPRRWR